MDSIEIVEYSARMLRFIAVLFCLSLCACGYRDASNPGPKTAAALDALKQYRAAQTVEVAQTEESAEAGARVVYTRCRPLVAECVATMREEGYNQWFISGFQAGNPDEERTEIMSDILQIRAGWMRQGATNARADAALKGSTPTPGQP